MAIGRNDVCHCGSGLKYKRCHAGKESRFSKGLIAAIVAVAAIAAVGVIPMLTSQERPERTVGVPRGPVARPGASQPPGPAPAGKVWSVDHGHWHDAPVQASIPVNTGSGPNAAQSIAQLQQQALAAQQQFKPGPQPPGPVPEGKVWSTEHGHWHDAPKAQ
jgi:hypothetical protein